MVDRLPDQRIAAEGAGELAQILVDAEREPHPLDGELERCVVGGSHPRRAGPRECGPAAWTTTRSPPTSSSRESTPPRRREVPSPPSRDGSRYGHGGRTSTSSGRATGTGLLFAEQVDVHQERAAGDDLHRALAAARPLRRAPSGAAARRAHNRDRAAPATSPPAAASAAVRTSSRQIESSVPLAAGGQRGRATDSSPAPSSLAGISIASVSSSSSRTGSYSKGLSSRSGPALGERLPVDAVLLHDPAFHAVHGRFNRPCCPGGSSPRGHSAATAGLGPISPCAAERLNGLGALEGGDSPRVARV